MKYSNVVKRSDPLASVASAETKDISQPLAQSKANVLNLLTHKKLSVAKEVKGQVASESESKAAISSAMEAQLAVPQALNYATTAFVDPRRFTGSFIFEDFRTVRIEFDAGQTKYDWGDLEEDINSPIFQKYFRTPQTSQPVDVEGIDPATAYSSKWGYLTFIIQSLRYTSRFGGAFHVRLIPAEKYGIELSDATKDIYVDLKQWALNVYIQPKLTMFNTPATAYNNITPNMVVEIDVLESEVYKRVGSKFVAHKTVDQVDVEGLIDEAADEALGRLRNIGLFALGFVHKKHMSSFDSIDERVTEIYVSDNICRFETELKRPYVQVLMETRYFGTGNLEGPFGGSAELTAEPWLSLKTDKMGLVVLSNRLEKYIGSGTTTGPMVFGYLSLDEAERVNYALAFPSYTEHDPLFDDHSFMYGLEFENLEFDKDELQNRADANDLGSIGDPLTAFRDDALTDGVTAFVDIRFNLVKF